MGCSRCGEPNTGESPSCPTCGEDLRPRCSRCGWSIAAIDRFCSHCGRRLEDSASGHGERRNITVLFVDLVSSTSLSRGLDLEDFHAVVREYLVTCSDVIRGYGGHVAQTLGDGLLSYFGYPSAHERATRKAVASGLELVRAVGALRGRSALARDLAVRVAIHMGPVVFGDTSGDGESRLAFGTTPNVTARLQEIAAPNTIVISEPAYRLVERDFLCEKQGDYTLKGLDYPIGVYRVEAVGFNEKLPPAGRRTELVGRTRELGRLKQADERVRNGEFSAVFVCGEAGTGKSRLVEEYRKLPRPDDFFWSEGQANDSAHGIPYHPIVDLLSRSWGIQGDDPPDRLRNTIETRLAELIADPGEVTPYVLSLYALDPPELTGISPEYWKRRLFSAVRAVLAAMAGRGQSVFLLEDLHWADPSTLELVRHLIDTLRVPAIVLCTSRVPFRDLRPFQDAKSTGTGATAVIEEIVLEPLAPEDTTVLTRRLLEDDEAPGELFTFIQERTDGNPFFIGEVLNSLIEDGVLEHRDARWRLTKPLAAFDVPPTVEGVIASRLDRQDPQSRRLLQEAAVMGRTFLLPILRDVTKCKGIVTRLSDLVESDLLIRASSVEPDITYLFKHALTREVAYASLLRSERAVIHRQVAKVMERLFADRLPEFFETLAFHFKQGRDLTNAAKYFIKSGDKAVTRFALEEATQHFRHAHELLQESEETEEQRELTGYLLEKWAILFYYYGDFRGLLELFGTHGTLIQSLKDKSRRGMLTAWSGVALFFRNRPQKAYHALKNALTIGEEVEDLRVIAYAVTWLTMVCGGLARFEEGIAHGERAQRLAQTMPDDHYLHFKSLGMLGFNYTMMGEAAKTHQVADALTARGEDPRTSFFASWMRAEGYSLAGNAKAARDAAEHGLRVLKDPFYLGFARAIYGMKCLFIGEQSASLDHALEQAVEQGNDFMVNWWRGLVGLGRVLRGQPAEGMRLIEEASKASAANGDTLIHQVNEYLKAKVFLQAFLAGREASAQDRAGSLLMSVIHYWRQVGARGWLAQALLDLGLLHQASDRDRDARACWTEAADLFEKVGADILLEQVRRLLAQSA